MDRKRIGQVLVALGGLLVLVWIARVALLANALQSHLKQIEAQVEARQINPIVACDLVQSLRGDVVALQQEAGVVVPLAPLFGWLPGVGGDLQSAPHLLVTADGLTEAGVIACTVLSPALDAWGKPGSYSLEEITALLAENQAHLERAAAAGDRAQLAWANVDTRRLSPSLARRAKLLERGMPLARAGLAFLSLAPDLMGANGKRTFLVLGQNEDELRATGGFVTGVGELQVQDGRLVAMTFRDSYAVDDFSQPYPDPPEPMQRYMGIEQWVFRDSNWSPDFPTVVREALALYRTGEVVAADGVIALDQYALQEITGALGSLTIKGAAAPVTKENVLAHMHNAWAPPGGVFVAEWYGQRKSFMGPLAEAVWARLKSGQFDLVSLGQTALRLLDQKHVIIYLREPRAAAVLAERGWDGALPGGGGDRLMVVDTNIGYNKASARVREALLYEVDLRPATPLATLTLTYTHTSKANYPCIFEARYDPVYEQMMERCYFDYIRIYTPQGSQLLDATRIPVPGQSLFSGKSESGAVTARPAEENGWTVFEVMGVLPTASSQTRVFTWSLPANVVKSAQAVSEYSLRVQKQPGTQAHPLTVRVWLPERAVLLESSPEPMTRAGAWLIFQTNLERDRTIHLHFGGDVR